MTKRQLLIDAPVSMAFYESLHRDANNLKTVLVDALKKTIKQCSDYLGSQSGYEAYRIDSIPVRVNIGFEFATCNLSRNGIIYNCINLTNAYGFTNEHENNIGHSGKADVWLSFPFFTWEKILNSEYKKARLEGKNDNEILQELFCVCSDEYILYCNKQFFKHGSEWSNVLGANKNTDFRYYSR